MFFWRVHSGLAAGRENELRAVLSAHGDDLQLVTGHWRDLPDAPELTEGETAGLALTTLQDAKRLLKSGWRVPRVLYFDETRFNTSFWLPRLASSIPVLNRCCMFVPFGMIAHLTETGLSPAEALFIRPDSGLKFFPGFVLPLSPGRNWAQIARELERIIPGASPELLVCFSRARELMKYEWRFWVVARKVVASSPYTWENGAVPYQPPPPEALDIARMTAANPWQPDVAYVADVVQLSDNGPFCLNELNAASTSGLYSVPIHPLTSALREAVLAEIAGELSIED